MDNLIEIGWLQMHRSWFCRVVCAAMVLSSLARDAQAGPPSEIVFAPASLELDNPASSQGASPEKSFEIELIAYDDRGERIEPSDATPIGVEVSGGGGVVTPRETRLTSGSSLTLRYDGRSFSSPITVAAWTEHGERKSLGRTQILPANPDECAYAGERQTLRVLCKDGRSELECGLDAIRRGLEVNAAAGFDDPRGHFQAFAIDTGSIGTVVPVERLGPDAIGPGAEGSVYYDSSGRVFSGNYYLASVAFETEDGRIIKTPRMMVLGIRRESCKPGHPDCRPSDDPGLHYLGVGFARGAANKHKFVSPADNAFLRLADEGGLSPGYVLNGRFITIGIASTDGYRLSPLAPSTTAPGDWSPPRGCFSFPRLQEPNRFCGNFLLDVGLTEMFLDLPPSQRPRGSEVGRRCGDRECFYVPDGAEMNVEVEGSGGPAMSYDFTMQREPRGPEPSRAMWIDNPNVFMNVGRRPLFRFHYMFDATCGNVGFARVE